MATYEMTFKVDLPEDFGEFQAIESKILTVSHEAGRKLLSQIMTDFEELKITKGPFQKKDRQTKKFQTLLGEVALERWRVFDVFKRKSAYVLDQWLGLKAYQKVTRNLVNEIIEECVTRPYAQATQAINKRFELKRTPMSNWKLIQSESMKQQYLVNNPKDWKHNPLPQLLKDKPDPCPLIAIDPDATYVHSRRKEESKHELKMAVVYTGKRRRGPRRWELRQKQVVLGVANTKAFNLFNRATHKAVRDYGLHSESKVLVHGDGDPWIKQLKNDYCPQALNRLDPYHAFEKIRRTLDIEKVPDDWCEDFFTKPSMLIRKIEGLKRELYYKKDKEKVNQLAQYFKNNKDGMEPSGIPYEIKKQYPGMFKRGSGTIESNVFQFICQRFKGPRMSWSEDGLNNLIFLREQFLNQSFDFEKIQIKREHFKEKTYTEELREVVKEDLC